MLDEASYGGGVGFCGSSLPELLTQAHYGPLVIALDSSILIDLQEHGSEILDQDLKVSEPKYRQELEDLGWIVDVWMLRYIRLIVPPRSRTDAKTGNVPDARGPAIDSLEASLAFQMDFPEQPTDLQPPNPNARVSGIPPDGDLDLIHEAIGLHASVFLTRDVRIVTRAKVRGAFLKIMSPSKLTEILRRAGVGQFGGGTCRSEECVYRGLQVPGPDTGKWSGLLSLFT